MLKKRCNFNRSPKNGRGVTLHIMKLIMEKKKKIVVVRRTSSTERWRGGSWNRYSREERDKAIVKQELREWEIRISIT